MPKTEAGLFEKSVRSLSVFSENTVFIMPYKDTVTTVFWENNALVGYC